MSRRGKHEPESQEASRWRSILANEQGGSDDGHHDSGGTHAADQRRRDGRGAVRLGSRPSEQRERQAVFIHQTELLLRDGLGVVPCERQRGRIANATTMRTTWPALVRYNMARQSEH